MKYVEFKGDNLDKVKEQALEELGKNENEVIIKSEEKKSLLKKTYIIKVYLIEDVANEIKNYLNEILSQMDIESQYEVKLRNEQISIKMFSNNNNILIGKNGKTLEALRVLIRQYIFNKIGAYPYILLDVEDYKEHQEHHLEYAARKIAKEVIKTKQPVVMDDMNSYERRIVHNALSKFDKISSESEGVEPHRHIIIKYKED